MGTLFPIKRGARVEAMGRVGKSSPCLRAVKAASASPI